MPPTILSAVASATAIMQPAYDAAYDFDFDVGPPPTPSVYKMHKSYTPLDDAHVDWFHQLLPVFLILGGLALGFGLVYLGLEWFEERKERKKNKIQDVEKGEVTDIVESFRAPMIARPAPALHCSDPNNPRYPFWIDMNDGAGGHRGMFSQ
ncbi:hypothetical protein FB45DRAFT_997587 [Roridomyces roridus]|uniref:Uncharacterized protein n=1 Tax=Roridomyces roridus TaxID=1738132 RepID=A0AAD7CK18_9AGAR|nr:hypothetical protein FB45DRAFT_997587 [Roridomyces roridus]